jgi:N-methylhydantoinase A
MMASGKPVELPRQLPRNSDCAEAVIKRKSVSFDGAWIDTPVFAREKLRAGNCVHGPAIVHEYSGTTVVLPGCKANVDEYLNLVIEVS